MVKRKVLPGRVQSRVRHRDKRPAARRGAFFLQNPSPPMAATNHHACSPFTRFAKWASREAGRPKAFTLAAIVLVVWAVSGPFFGFSDTWQLIINTGTTIITFLMVFLIQNTQNRDSEAIHVKLD